MRCWNNWALSGERRSVSSSVIPRMEVTMGIELTKEQHEVLKQTARVETPAEFQALLATAKPRMDKIVQQVQEPAQGVAATLTEARDLALTVHQYAAQLDGKAYLQANRAAFFDAIRLLDTAQTWFGEGVRTGAFRTRSVDEVVQASRPWRARIAAIGAHAFAFDEELAEQFADVNSSGTLEEEIDDLFTLNNLVDQHKDELMAVGLTEKQIQEGTTLYAEANGRDLAGILGLRNRSEAVLLRNRILTYATLLAREARAAGVNACYDDPEARRRFEAASFRQALRKLRSRRGRGTGADEGETEGETAQPQGTLEGGETPAPAGTPDGNSSVQAP
ncbi:MAG: hypothetical protein R3B70_22895 [Polyangiaceae bacterium]